MKRLIVGEGASSSEFQRTVFRSFLETLVQSLYDLTSDIKEYVRLGRGLWPRYIAPVLAENIDKTLESIRRANAASKANGSNPTTNGVGTIATTQREILSLLDQRIFPHIRHALEHGFGALAFDSPGVVVVTNKTSKETSVNSAEAVAHDIPYLAKYLLLAAYVCQANRPDRDKQLFSIQTNGKKRRGANDDTGEDVAFGSGSQDRLKTLRPRAFPLERLYSLYVSMVSLNPSNEDDDNAPMNQDGIMLRSLGNVSFHETVAYLIDIGILHDYPKRSASDTIRISQRSLWSSITRDEAQEVAKSVKFPLDRYIL